jgi:hypothetical protein
VVTGRPKIEIDWNEFGKLCGLQCTLSEISAWFDVSEDTIERRVKEEYEQTFAEIFRQKRGKGLISLRRKQFKLADKSAAMAIFLGKNYLGQRDSQEIEIGENAQEYFNKIADAIEKSDSNTE